MKTNPKDAAWHKLYFFFLIFCDGVKNERAIFFLLSILIGNIIIERDNKFQLFFYSSQKEKNNKLILQLIIMRIFSSFLLILIFYTLTFDILKIKK